MHTNLIEKPAMNVTQHTIFAAKQNKHSTPHFSWDFEIQELDDQETYSSHGKPLMHNDLNSFVVDWEMPKMENAV